LGDIAEGADRCGPQAPTRQAPQRAPTPCYIALPEFFVWGRFVLMSEELSDDLRVDIEECEGEGTEAEDSGGEVIRA
jgi:hypothetical protein